MIKDEEMGDMYSRIPVHGSACMGEEKCTQRFGRKSEGKRPLERHSC
jgi:hypothetical protein